MTGSGMSPSRIENTSENERTIGTPLLTICETGDQLLAYSSDKIAYVDFRSFSAETLLQHCPDVVLSPLVSASFDCFDLAEKLVAAGFRGKLKAAIETLPNPKVIKREFAAQFPGLDFELVLLDQQAEPPLREV